VYHSTLDLRVIKKKEKEADKVAWREQGLIKYSRQWAPSREGGSEREREREREREAGDSKLSEQALIVRFRVRFRAKREQLKRVSGFCLKAMAGIWP